MVGAFFEGCRADEHGHAAAVLAEVLLLKRGQDPGPLQLWHPLSGIAVEPFRWGQVGPADATRCEILTIVAHDAEKGVIGLEDPAFEIPYDDPDDVSVDQAPDLLFASFKIAVEPDVLLGRFPPLSRFEPCERQRRPC